MTHNTAFTTSRWHTHAQRPPQSGYVQVCLEEARKKARKALSDVSEGKACPGEKGCGGQGTERKT
jgi:hypothetical protein